MAQSSDNGVSTPSGSGQNLLGGNTIDEKIAIVLQEIAEFTVAASKIEGALSRFETTMSALDDLQKAANEAIETALTERQRAIVEIRSTANQLMVLIRSEFNKITAAINQARDAAIAAIHAAKPSGGSASQESKNRNIEGRTYRETGR